MLCFVVHTSYLSKRWLPSDSMCRTTFGVLVRSSCSRCPLICVAQWREITTVLNTGGPFKLLAHSVTIKHITLTRCTLGDREENDKGRFMNNIKPRFLIWQRIHSSLTVRLQSNPNSWQTNFERIIIIIIFFFTGHF